MRRNDRTEARGRRSSASKEINTLVQKARDQGWIVMHSGGGHLIFRSPDKTKPQIVVASTPGGGNRGVENTTARLKRAGLVMNRRRRLRKNPSTGTLLAIGAGVAIAAFFALRGSSTSSALPVATTIPPSAAPDMAAMFRARREQGIAQLMAGTPGRPGMTRAAAETYYDRSTAMVTSAVASLTSAHGIGSYYRT